LRILFDKNVPDAVRRFLPQHDVHTVIGMQWPERLKNGELLNKAEEAGFDVLVNMRPEHPVPAESHRPEARLGRTRLQYLAARAAT